MNDRTPQIVARPSKVRALLAFVLAAALPVGLLVALDRAGYGLVDYPMLIARGELNWLTQLLAWVALCALAVIYLPHAWRALKRASVISTSGQFLMGPSGRTYRIAGISYVSVRKTFWHKVMLICSEGEDHREVVTFARELVPALRTKLKEDPNLAGIEID